MTATATALVTRYHGRITDAAEHIITNARSDDDHGSWSAAIAVCGTACEAAAAYALGTFVTQLGGGPSARYKARLVNAVNALLGSRDTVNLRWKEQRKLWHSLTNDDITKEWRDYSKYPPFVKLRNAVVHTGRVDDTGTLPSRKDAEDALALACSFHAYIKAVMEREGLSQYA
jgi:hypothetical protein